MDGSGRSVRNHQNTQTESRAKLNVEREVSAGSKKVTIHTNPPAGAKSHEPSPISITCPTSPGTDSPQDRAAGHMSRPSSSDYAKYPTFKDYAQKVLPRTIRPDRESTQKPTVGPRLGPGPKPCPGYFGWERVPRSLRLGPNH